LFTGFVSDATRDALYARCRALVMPSRGEGFGLVYLEAMRAARPCVALVDSAAAEIVVDGETGALVQPTPESLREALTRLSSEALALRLGEAACRRYETRFAPARFRETLFGHLDALLGAGARRAA
jgi:glycosyltransferase involved in cell wall biosynthesis